MESTSTSAQAVEDSAHPWPYLAPLFKFMSAAINTYRFQRLLCSPKVTEVFAFHNSPSKKILYFVVHGLLPLSTVELLHLKDLTSTLQPNNHVLSRGALRRNIMEAAVDVKQKLVAVLNQSINRFIEKW